MLTFDFHTNTATKSSKLDLVSMLASTIKDDPTIGSLVYGLHGGAEFPPSQELAFDSLQGRPLPDETERQFVDIARLEAICSTNACVLLAVSVERTPDSCTLLQVQRRLQRASRGQQGQRQ